MINKLNNLLLSRPWVMFRNNRGVAYRNGKPIFFGIPEPPRGKQEDRMKGGDWIGFTPITITEDMVGKIFPIWTSVELKTETDRISAGQIRWHNFVLKNYGISEIWKDTGDKIEIFNEFIEVEK